MPELPDLQVFSRNLSRILVGKTVKKIDIINKKKLKTTEKVIREHIEGATLSKIYREGKELHLAFDNGNVLGLHMMLRGNLHFFKEKNDNKFTIIEILFGDGHGLAMTDFQGQANATLNPMPREAPDALSKTVGYSFLKDHLRTSRAEIKKFLLDQNKLRGIGNAYADEILWESGISPFSIGGKIPDAQLKVLAIKIKTVLQKAEKTILKKHPDLISGEVRDFMAIHNAERTHSPTGAKIRIRKAGGRKTYYTDEQKLFK